MTAVVESAHECSQCGELQPPHLEGIATYLGKVEGGSLSYWLQIAKKLDLLTIEAFHSSNVGEGISSMLGSYSQLADLSSDMLLHSARDVIDDQRIDRHCSQQE